MRHIPGWWPTAAALLVGLLLPQALQAQEGRRADRDGARSVFRMEIFNGPTRTVRYFGPALSVSERSTLLEAEQLENEATLARELQTVKQQYVTSERILEPHRRAVQRALYGTEVTSTDYAATAASAGYSGLPYVYPGVTTVTAFGNSWWPGMSTGAVAGERVTVNRSLANGVGDEGRMKDALSRVIALQSTPEYLDSVRQARTRVVARAASSPTLREVLGIDEAGARPRGDGVREAADGGGGEGVTVTLKSGEKVHGTRIEENKDWVIVHTAGGRSTRIRQGEVVRIDLPAKGS